MNKVKTHSKRGSSFAQIFPVPYKLLCLLFLVRTCGDLRWSCSYGDNSEVRPFPNPRYAGTVHIGPSDVDQNLNEFTVSYQKRRTGRVIS